MALKRLIVFALALLALSAPAYGETIVDPAPFRPALYVVRDADSTMYLYGTVHVRRAGAPWGGADAQAALASAEDVWTEMEMSPEADARAAAVVVQLGRAPPGRPLSSWLSSGEAAALAALMQRFNMPPAMLEGMRPWLAAITLSLAPMQLAGYSADSGVDRAVVAAAIAANKNMRAFETAEEQIGVMASLSEEAQREMLLEAISESERGPQELATLTRAWEAGDANVLEAVVIDEMRDRYPEMYDILFRQRNAAWIEVLLRELDGAGADFVAVGAGHLLGEDGLVAQLQAHGFSVERVAP
ncbi:MAG: TraB/GumN family protein [Hyphomonadaceae bacterium]